MSPQRDPNAVAANWSQRLGQSTQKIKDGVAATQVAPGLAAARQADVWAANVANAKQKWASNVANVSLQEWQQSMINKGVDRIATGATAAQPKMAAFMTALLPQIDRVVGTLPARGNTEANIARAVAFMRGMSQWSYKKPAGV